MAASPSKVYYLRDNNTLTFGVAHSKITPADIALDRDFHAFNGPPYVVRHAETATLDHAFDRPRTQHNQVLAVSRR